MRVKAERTGEGTAIALVVGRSGMPETGAEQGQWAAQKVVTDYFQRHQAELGIESGQRR
ncbi:hypothetical protein D3C76_1755390 [compost metagenome]